MMMFGGWAGFGQVEFGADRCYQFVGVVADQGWGRAGDVDAVGLQEQAAAEGGAVFGCAQVVFLRVDLQGHSRERPVGVWSGRGRCPSG